MTNRNKVRVGSMSDNILVLSLCVCGSMCVCICTKTWTQGFIHAYKASALLLNYIPALLKNLLFWDRVSVNWGGTCNSSSVFQIAGIIVLCHQAWPIMWFIEELALESGTSAGRVWDIQRTRFCLDSYPHSTSSLEKSLGWIRDIGTTVQLEKHLCVWFIVYFEWGDSLLQENVPYYVLKPY